MMLSGEYNVGSGGTSTDYVADDQTYLDKYYGTNYYTIFTITDLKNEYIYMVNKINNYRGFYIGRYETTIDGTSIGSKENKTVLTTDAILKEGINKSSNEPYYYRWYGLYYEQKKADVTGNGTDVQTAMVYGQLWNKTMEFIREQKELGKTTYDVDTETESWHTDDVVRNSGQQNPAKDGDTGDVALNIWDLESNAYEASQMKNMEDYISIVKFSRHWCSFFVGEYYLSI